jgi:hypothetical protein
MNRFALLGCLALALTTFSCGEPLPAPPATEPEQRTVLKTLTANASWELDLGPAGNVIGDQVTIIVHGNGQSVPVALEFQLRDSTNFAVAGSFHTTTYQPGGTWNTGIRGFNVGGGPGLLMGAPQSSIPIATITQLGPDSFEVDFSGVSYYAFYGGEGQEYVDGDFTFTLGADLPPDETEIQLPIPDGDFEALDVDEPEMCPVWLFEETAFGNRLDGSPSQRSNLEDLNGDEVRTGWNGSQFVIKMESNLIRPDGELFGITIILDQFPVEGVHTTYPVQVFSAIDNLKKWTIDQPGTGTLEIVDWSQGAFNAVVTFDNFELRDDEELGTLDYWERSVDGELWFYAPLPEYNDAYDDLCTHFEEDEGWSILATIQAVMLATECAHRLKLMLDNCNPGVLADPSAHPFEKVEAAIECVLRAKLAYDACMKLVP